MVGPRRGEQNALCDLSKQEASVPGIHLLPILERQSYTVNMSCLVKIPRSQGAFSWEHRWITEVHLKLRRNQ